MTIPDPFAPFEGGILHQADIEVAQAFGGAPGRSISWHAVRPLVRRGFGLGNALALFHIFLIGVAAGGLALLVRRLRR